MPVFATLLDDVSAIGAGASFVARDIAANGFEHLGALSNMGIDVIYNGGNPTAATILLEGSNDGINWVEIGRTTDVSTSPVGFDVGNTPKAYFRANLTVYTAGPNTGITVTCIGVK